MRESSRKRVLDSHNTITTTELKTRLSKQIIYSCSLKKKKALISMMCNRKGPYLASD